MTGPAGTAMLADGFGLLDRAVGYALDMVDRVTPAALLRSTPCRDWDLRSLLWHLTDSLGVLRHGIETGLVDLDPVVGCGPQDTADLVATVRERAEGLRSAGRAAAERPWPVVVADLPVEANLVACAGAIEVAVHGWDVAQACGHDVPIPATLASSLLDVCPLVVTELDRPGLFAPQVAAPPAASPGHRLVAFLGRARSGDSLQG